MLLLRSTALSASRQKLVTLLLHTQLHTNHFGRRHSYFGLHWQTRLWVRLSNSQLRHLPTSFGSIFGRLALVNLTWTDTSQKVKFSTNLARSNWARQFTASAVEHLDDTNPKQHFNERNWNKSQNRLWSKRYKTNKAFQSRLKEIILTIGKETTIKIKKCQRKERRECQSAGWESVHCDRRA